MQSITPDQHALSIARAVQREVAPDIVILFGRGPPGSTARTRTLISSWSHWMGPDREAAPAAPPAPT